MLGKVAGDELSNHAAEVGGHQHIFQSHHSLAYKLSVHSLQKVGKVQHCTVYVSDRNPERDTGLGVEMIERGNLGRAINQV
jgi:hypothetical protein